MPSAAQQVAEAAVRLVGCPLSPPRVTAAHAGASGASADADL